MPFFHVSIVKRKSIQKLGQVSIKISEFSFFFFNCKLNEKKKVPLKKLFGEGKLQEKSCWRGGLIFNRGFEIFQKRGL